MGPPGEPGIPGKIIESHVRYKKKYFFSRNVFIILFFIFTLCNKIDFKTINIIC